MLTLGETIRNARKALGISQKDLASRVKNEDGDPISPQYLNDIELNRRTPTPHLIGEIARALKLNADVLHSLAGRLPPDVKATQHKPEQIEAAMKAFRRELRKG